MEVTTVVATIATAAANVKSIYEASKTSANAELKQMIADLSMQLVDASLRMAELKHKVIRLQQENADLKAKSEMPTPKMLWGCYKFQGMEGLYCPKCFENSGKMHRTARAENGRFYRCSVCGAMHSTG